MHLFLELLAALFIDQVIQNETIGLEIDYLERTKQVSEINEDTPRQQAK